MIEKGWPLVADAASDAGADGLPAERVLHRHGGGASTVGPEGKRQPGDRLARL
jgi:hypothetical protein